MNSSHFDIITRQFAARRTSRRAALAAGAGIVALGLAPAGAQDASPVVSDSTEEDVHFLFVQTFGAGSLTEAGEDGVMSLVADHLLGQTLYFTDRPERTVGMVSTARFLGAGRTKEGLGFTPANPPTPPSSSAARTNNPAMWRWWSWSIRATIRPPAKPPMSCGCWPTSMPATCGWKKHP